MSNIHSPTTKKGIEINWQLCIICQETTQEPLQCPANLNPGHAGFERGYTTFSDSVHKFLKLKVCLPVPLKLECLNGETSMVDTLNKKEGKWHKTCRLKFSNRELDRATKRLHGTTDSELICSDATPAKVTRKTTANATVLDKEMCFICNKHDGSILHKISTFAVDKKVRMCAHILQDTILLSKLASGDLISQDAVYHLSCLMNLYRRAEKEQQIDSCNDNERELQGIALAELIEFISESHEESVSVFKLFDLLKMYKERIMQLGVDKTTRVHSTRLKTRLMIHFKDMYAYNEGREVLLAFNDGVGFALKKFEDYIDYDNDAVILCKAANIVRRDILNSPNCDFKGTFGETCQQNATPRSLQTLVEMVLGGSNIKTRTSKLIEFQSAMTIAQLIMFNSTNIRRNDTSKNVFNCKQRETPLPMYVGLTFHAETRKCGLVDKLHDLGLSIAYRRVLEISTAVGNSVCQQYHEQGVVFPPNLQSGHFTTAAVDNIDHNPSSTTAKGALHGTAISLFQNGRDRVEDSTISALHNSESSALSLKPLPHLYVTVPPVSLWKADPLVPEMPCDMSLTDTVVLDDAMNREDMWLKHVDIACLTDENVIDAPEAVSWSAYHAVHSPTVPVDGIDKTAMLPIFQDEAKSTAMIRHSIDVIKNAVHHLNPHQIPVMACDQPLYAIAKQIQWNWPLLYGENKVVIMFGGLHIEMAAWKTIGDWLDDSGWTAALVHSNIATLGKADAFLKSSHVSRTRHVHEVTACSLYILQRRAYNEYVESVTAFSDEEIALDFKQWVTKQTKECPQFQYWSITLTLELAILVFVRSLREGNYMLYIQALNQLNPCFFALDHTNYSRWLPIHPRDLAALPEMNPSVFREFSAGKFVIHKTMRSFSGIAIDHAHEQNNRCVKEDGGAIGLTENSSQLLRWMISGPEIARITSKFEVSHDRLKHEQSTHADTHHHEERKSHQKRFIAEVRSLVETIDAMGNPFQESSEDLLQMDTRDIADERVVETVRRIERVGQEQYTTFVKERLVKRTTSLSDPIKKNKLSLFRCQESNTKKPSIDKQTITSLKRVALSSRSYMYPARYEMEI